MDMDAQLKEKDCRQAEKLSYTERFALMIPLLVFLSCLVLTAIALVPAFLRLQPFWSPSSNSRGLDGITKFFVFGDSYVDVGNIPFGLARNPPYGITWPGHAAGRFSNGHVQSDYLAAQVLGLPSPLAYAESNMASIAHGINFAVGGSSMTYGYGIPPIGNQVRLFESLVSLGVYTVDILASSVALFCVSGNDYGSYKGSIENYLPFIGEVVGLIEQSLLKLYGMGLRNIMVTTVAPLNCLPASTYLTNYMACSPNATVDALVSTHNLVLETTLVKLSKELSGINFILLRQDAALAHILNNPSYFNISQAFKPCCFGSCGELDHHGKPLYTVCKEPDAAAMWDSVHPTQAAWENIVKLYLTDGRFTKLSPTLEHWRLNLLSGQQVQRAETLAKEKIRPRIPTL